MITGIELGGIKSFPREVRIPCGAITLITGTNSSGKSTILQVLLLLKQSMGSHKHQAGLLINGPLVRLGTSQDLLASGSKDQDLRLGCEYTRDDEHTSSLSVTCDAKDADLILKTFKCVESNADKTRDILLSREGENEQLMSVAESQGHRYAYGNGEQYVLFSGIHPLSQITRTHGYAANQKAQFGKLFDELARPLLQSFATALKLKGPKERAALAEAIRFLNDSDKILEAVVALGRISEVAERVQKADHALLEKLIPVGESNLREILTESRYAALEQMIVFLEDLASEEFVLTLGQQSKNLARPEFTSEHKDLIEKVRDELSGSIGKVLYLGPLRQDPQLLFEDKPVEDASELGTKGEGTVALLFYNKDRVVNYVAPETVYEETPRSISGSVLEALNVWVSYLGIADCVDVARAPPYGLTLKIRSPGVGEVASDLTNVGVGASQALPILLLGICAPLGATIIYEQPELHLHPALQCKLTDFFVAQLKMGKQVILETHSEHIVNTVRLHIAKGSLTAEGLSLIFCERDQNGSTATVIDVDRRGLLPRWPSGFFDKSEQTLAEILRKALE